MKKILLLIKKNLKNLIRARGSALIIFFAPLLLILIVGLSFNTTNKYGINIGVYSPTTNEDVVSFISTLEDEDFKVIPYSNSVDDCIKELKQGFVHTCISLPDSFSISSNKPIEIDFHIDPSKINIVWMVQETLRNKFNIKSKEITENLIESMLGKIDKAKTDINTQKEQVEKIIESNNNIATNTEQTKTSLSNINFQLVSVPNTRALNDFEVSMYDKITSGKSNLDDAKEKFTKANLTFTGKDEIVLALSDSSSDVDGARKLINGTNAKDSYSAVRALVNSLVDGLTLTNEKMINASSTVSSSTKSLDDLSNSVKSTTESLNSLQTQLNMISEGLNVEVNNAEIISKPLITNIKRIVPQRTHLTFFFPSLLILVLMFSSLVLGTILVMMEKNSPAFIRNYFVPVRKSSFIISTYLTTLFLIFIQLAIIIGISLFFLTDLKEVLIPIILVLLLSASIFTFIGMIIGYLFNSEETGIIASISIGSLFLFISGVILPIESVTEKIRNIISLNPYVIGEKLVREIYIFGSSIDLVLNEISILLLYTIILFILILFAEVMMRKKMGNKFIKKKRKKKIKYDKKKV